MEPPLLLSGTAGCGKTTIAVYYLLKREFLGKRRLFLTFSPNLKRFSQRIYEGLVRHTDLKEHAPQPDFVVLRDLMRDILKKRGKEYDDGREVRLQEFKEIFSSHTLSRKYDAELVWEEVRSIIKGAKPPLSVQRYRKLISDWLSEKISRSDMVELRDSLLGLKRFEGSDRVLRALEKKTGYASYDEFVSNIESGPGGARSDAAFLLQEVIRTVEKKAHSFSSPLLSFEEYQMLGKKRAPNFLYDRRDIYSIAEYYQSRLEAQGLWDEVDLTRSAIQTLGTLGDDFLYDLLVCDEVQDFSDIQLALLFRLVRSCNSVLLAGDTTQIINPSGFRWEEVKDRFFERGVQVPPLFNLNLNFRCVGSIVRLANSLLDLKQKLVGLSGSELREEWKFNGKPPILINGLREEQVIEMVRITGAGQIILVRDSDEGNRLKRELGTELVFTIHEAKGLEFDTVLLWRFCMDRKSATIWRKIKQDHQFDRSHFPHIKHEINLLYVAVTRARNSLIIYDGNVASDVWDVELLGDPLYRSGQGDDFLKIWQRVSSPAEWDEQGHYFFEREHYPAAVECFRNAGNIEMAETAQAWLLEGKKEYRGAAELFEKRGNAARAALNYERAGEYERAMELWDRLGESDRAGLCRLRLYETEGQYDRAADGWEKRGDLENALKNWEKAQNHRKIGEYYRSKKNYTQAAQRFEQAGMAEEACALYKKMKMYDRAASLYYRSGDYPNALKLFEKAGMRADLIRCYEKLKDNYSIALLYEKSKEIPKAIDYFRIFAQVSQQNKQTLEQEAIALARGRGLLRSALRYSALGMHDRSAPIFLQKGYTDIALRELEKIDDPLKRAACYETMGDHYNTALELEKAEGPDTDVLVEEALVGYLYPQRYFNRTRAQRLFDEAEQYMRTGEPVKALRRFKAIHYPEGVYNAYLRLERDEEAIEYLMENDMLEEAEEYVLEKPDCKVSPELIRRMFMDAQEQVRSSLVRYHSIDFIGRLLALCFKQYRDKETLAMIKKILIFVSANYYIGSRERFPKEYLELALELDCPNAIFRILSFRHYGPAKKRLPKNTSSYLAAVGEKAERTRNGSLLACYYYFHDREKFEEILNGLEVGPDNYELFAKSSRLFRKAIEYLSGMNEVEKAAIIARSHNLFGLAGEIYEKAGDLRSAGRHYRDAKNYEQALTCFEKLGDRREIARVYERMAEYRKALDIWETLGNKREVQRIVRKIKKEAAERDQLDLF